MSSKIQYDFTNDIFKKNPFYKRLAKDHISLSELDSSVIKWEINETRSPLNIPCEYLIHYHIKSIIGVNAEQMPIYGNKHTVKIMFPPKYPIDPPELYVVTDVWHPNIKWDGKYKGRICGNTKGFGLGYDLFLLLIRIGEMLQYKQYHAEYTPPFPEDIHVAKWVLEFAEPKQIVNKKNGVTVDETPLVGKAEIPVVPTIVEEPKKVEEVKTEVPVALEKPQPRKIVIGALKKAEKKQININKVDE